jgi:hypothetical protein
MAANVVNLEAPLLESTLRDVARKAPKILSDFTGLGADNGVK